MITNPFKTETLNLTSQCEVLRSNPSLAAQLKAAAEKEETVSAPDTAINTNPFRKGTVNLTVQCELLRSNPSLAAQLKAAAEKEEAASAPFVPMALTRQCEIARAVEEAGKLRKVAGGLKKSLTT